MRAYLFAVMGYLTTSVADFVGPLFFCAILHGEQKLLKTGEKSRKAIRVERIIFNKQFIMKKLASIFALFATVALMVTACKPGQ